MLRMFERPKFIRVASYVLVFFMGMAASNGYVTENAVHSAVSDAVSYERHVCYGLLHTTRGARPGS